MSSIFSIEPRMYTHYKSVICQDLIHTSAIQNIMEFPKITQIVLNTSSPSTGGSNRLLSGQCALQFISGNRSSTTRSQKSIAAFNVRKNALLGSAVHLRESSRVHSFLDQYLTFFCAITASNRQKPIGFNWSVNNFQSFPGIQAHFLAFSHTGGFNCTLCVSNGNPAPKDVPTSSFQSLEKKASAQRERYEILLTAFQIPITSKESR